MADPIVKLAQAGYSALTAGDENLIFSSQWPLLKIYKAGKATIYDNTDLQILTNHDLGFTPVFWWFSNTKLEDWGILTAGSSVTPAQRSEYQGMSWTGFIYADSKRLFYRSTSSNGFLGGVDIYYYLFALDLNAKYTAPKISVGSQTSAGKEGPVFKIAKAGIDAESNNLEDFIIHSDTRSPLVHTVQSAKIAPYPSGGFSAVMPHNLGYIPFFFGYRKGDSLYPDAHKSLFSFSNGVGFVADEQTIRYKDTTDTGRSYTTVVLKDPFDIDYNVEVTI